MGLISPDVKTLAGMGVDSGENGFLSPSKISSVKQSSWLQQTGRLQDDEAFMSSTVRAKNGNQSNCRNTVESQPIVGNGIGSHPSGEPNLRLWVGSDFLE
ncbi:MAG: hypothetical protein R3C11_16880 [Planctomycetaceae bacterium]